MPLHPLLRRTPAALLTAALAAGSAHATNGYFSHGIGARAQGLAGVGIALPQDGLAGAINPAGTGAVGDRLDLGLTWFAPSRGARIVGNAFGPDASYSGDGRMHFLIPEVGVARRLSDKLSVGLALYGNGGLNTDYAANPYARFGASGDAGVNLEQLFITPSLAWAPNGTQRLGIALNIARQRFEAKGLGLFAGLSSAPGKVSNQGPDHSTDVGVRVGWAGVVAPGLSLGATWASRIDGRFDRYKGLFADAGGFDVPEQWGLGLAWQVSPAWNLAADAQRIRYSAVGSVGNSVARLFGGQPLGAADGPGFGWRDVTALKIGVTHQARRDLVLRAGLSHARQPVPAGETFFNILAPGVIQDHVTVGATWTLPGGGELSGFVLHAPRKTVNGAGSIPPGLPSAGGFGGGNANVHLRESAIGIAYGLRI